LRERCVQDVENWQGRHLANTAHALAKLNLCSGEWRALWDRLAYASHRRLRDATPQQLANTARAFATAGHAPPALFDAIAAEATPRLVEFNPQDLANMA
jgi:hypothetical protein